MSAIMQHETSRPSSDSTSPVNHFSLAGFTGVGYDRGRGTAVQILWLMVRGLLMKWWCPNAVRIRVLTMFGADIEAGAIVRHHVKIHWPWKLAIGRDSWIGEEAWILNLEPVTIGSNTCISQGVLVCTGSHDRRSATFEFDNAPVQIGDSVWVAARATVLRGVQIHDGATVGAAAVVTRDVPAGATVLAAAPRIQQPD